ncbi:uncharacterized protein [Ptychodera flava]|uniref:uncharacterized protein n=1 Tax=Ptychodera flava TaxID=63121 RepID=UPI00396A7250
MSNRREKRRHWEIIRQGELSASSSNSSSRSSSLDPKPWRCAALEKKLQEALVCSPQQGDVEHQRAEPNNHLQTYLDKLEERIKKKKRSRKKYLNTPLYATPTFAGGVFDYKGGELAVADGSVRLCIPPNAVNQSRGPYKLYIFLTHNKHEYPSKIGVKGMNVTPVVRCGPHGRSFDKPVLLTMRTAIDGKYKELKLLKSETDAGKECEWKFADSKEALCVWDRGRCIVAVQHFTLYRVIGRGGESILKGVFKIHVYIVKENGNSIKLRVRVFPDNEADLQVVKAMELDQGAKLLDGLQRIAIQQGKGITIKLVNLSHGWSPSNPGSMDSVVSADFIWEGESRQQTGVVRTITINHDSGGDRPKLVEGTIQVHETGRPDSGSQIDIKEHVSLPTAEEYPQPNLQSTARRPAAAKPSLKTVDDTFRNSLPEFQKGNNHRFEDIIPWKLYLDLCVKLDIKGQSDARFFAERIGLSTETIQYLTDNISCRERSVADSVLDFWINLRVQAKLQKREILEELASLLQDIGHEQAAILVRGHISPKQNSASSCDSGIASPSSMTSEDSASGDTEGFKSRDRVAGRDS